MGTPIKFYQISSIEVATPADDCQLQKRVIYSHPLQQWPKLPCLPKCRSLVYCFPVFPLIYLDIIFWSPIKICSYSRKVGTCIKPNLLPSRR